LADFRVLLYSKLRWLEDVVQFNLLTISLMHLGNHGGGSSTLVPPVGRQLSGGTVVPGKTVDTALDKNQTELGVLILAIALQVLTDLNSLLDEHVQILGNLGGKSVCLEDAHDLLSGDAVNLSDAVGVTEDHANLGRGETLLGEVADLFLDVGNGELAPAGWGALVRAGALGDTLSWCMKTSHAVTVKERAIKMI